MPRADVDPPFFGGAFGGFFGYTSGRLKHTLIHNILWLRNEGTQQSRIWGKWNQGTINQHVCVNALMI